jgi:hypothetical protein
MTEVGAARQYTVDIVRFTGLPIVFITTENEALIDSKDDYRKGNVKIVGGRGYKDLESVMKIRGRGNTTWAGSPKKPYQMKLSKKKEVLGMRADKKWVFLAEYFDKTMLRNRTAFELGHISHLDWTPSSVYAEVVINDKYRGTYHITQKVEESVNRVNVGKKGYLLEIDRLTKLDANDVYFRSSKYLISIKEPKVKKEDEKYRYISQYITDFEKALFGEDFMDSQDGYAKYIDVDSFVDWYLINEITKNVDALGHSSIYMNLIPGGKLKMGPIWDFDLAFGNMNSGDTEFPIGFWIKNNIWITRLFEDPSFVIKVKKRFSYFREKESYIVGIINLHAQRLARSQSENDKVWKTIGIYIWPNPVWFSTYNLEVEQLKGWFSQRMDWLEGAYKSL